MTATNSEFTGALVRDPTAAPPSEARRTVLSDVREIVGELRGSRDLVHQLTLRDIRIRYKQAVFGFAWAILIPMSVVLAGLAIRFAFAYMSGRGINKLQIAGMMVKAVPWAFFVGCLNTTTPSLVANRSLVTKIYFPREVLPLSAIFAQTFDSLIGAVLVVISLPFLGVVPGVELLWVPVLLAILWTLALAAGLFLSCANLFFRDVKYLVQVFLTFGIFITPVLLDASAYGPTGSHILMLNPMGPILEGLRLSIVEHHNLLQPMVATSRGADFQFWRPFYLYYSAAWAVCGLFFSAILFHRSERRFAELV